MKTHEIKEEFSDNLKLNISQTSTKKKKIKKSKLESKPAGKEPQKRGKKGSRHMSKELEAKEEKKLKGLESPMRSSHPVINSKLNKAGNESPLKDESSKGHHEIVSLLSNPTMLFNDASSIKCSIDNQNMSNFSIPSISGEQFKANFDSLDGMCLDLISAFVGEKFPSFIFVNKKI